MKLELVRQGQKYAAEALTYRDKIASLALGFIKDDSVVCFPRASSLYDPSCQREDPDSFLFESRDEDPAPCPREKENIGLRDRSTASRLRVRSYTL